MKSLLLAFKEIFSSIFYAPFCLMEAISRTTMGQKCSCFCSLEAEDIRGV